MLATGEDLRYRSTEGAKSDLRTRLMHRYMDAIGRLTTSEPAVRLRLLRALHMIAPPASLFSPAMLGYVFGARRSVSPEALHSNPAHARHRPRTGSQASVARNQSS